VRLKPCRIEPHYWRKTTSNRLQQTICLQKDLGAAWAEYAEAAALTLRRQMGAQRFGLHRLQQPEDQMELSQQKLWRQHIDDRQTRTGSI